MIVVKLPQNNLEERKYIVGVVFEEFLGTPYRLEKGKTDYEIVLPNRKVLLLKDTFFNRFPTKLTYLKAQNIPNSLAELDLFAACFFMLTRWEEYVIPVRDRHGRFPAQASLAYREGFLHRPVVNDRIEKFKRQLSALDPGIRFAKRRPELFVTHDVDHVKFWNGPLQALRLFLGDLIKRKDPRLAQKRLKEYIGVTLGVRPDPYDTFDRLMDLSEKAGLQSRFYFMSGGSSRYDGNYRIEKQKRLIEHIRKRGHLIGIHPSYESFDDADLLAREKERLETVCGCSVTEGRQHYLRFEVPRTWQIWEDNGLRVDSTCGYADMPGYRCGTGDTFSVFNILTRKKLKLKERPLVVMDRTLFDYARYDHEEAKEKILHFRNADSSFTILWHNSYIRSMELYGEILEKSGIDRSERL